MKELRGDLHVHTCLSPCAENEMLPDALLCQAKEKGLDLVAITDHNSAQNVLSFKGKAQAHGVGVIGGMEITSSEEAHLLAYFDDDLSLFEMQRIVHESLPSEKNDEEYFGRQVIVDPDGNEVGVTDKLLIGATALGASQIVETVHRLGGLCVAAHIDREAFSLLGQLGFIPPELALDAVELSPLWRTKGFVPPDGLPLVTSSDAHRLEEVGRASTAFLMDAPTVSELRNALCALGGRKATI